MKVVCIDTEECGLEITKGKIYSVLCVKIFHKDDFGESLYEIRDDNGSLCYPIKNRFVPLKEYRKQKLEKLNNEK